MTSTPQSRRPREAEEFLAVLHDTAPDAPTACPDWSAHDVGAHVAGVYEEVVRHVRAYSAGSPLTVTRGFAEREAPFRAMTPSRLLAAVEDGEESMRREIDTVLAGEPDADLAWTGRRMRVASFAGHLRSECALHRWDIAGEDGTDSLAQWDLLEHAVIAIGSGPLLARGVAAGAADGEPFTGRIRAPGQPDLLVHTASGSAGLSVVEPVGAATITTDPAARLLMLWGRAPQPAFRLGGDTAEATGLRRLLAGY